MTTVLTLTEARANLPSLVDRVAAGEEITLTRHGRPVAVLVRPDTLRARRADRALEDAAAVEEALAVGRRTALSAAPRLSSDRADALVEHVQASRSGR